MRIAIAGGTGTVGRHCVSVAESAGHAVTVLARSRGIDITTGRGLATALDGIDAVIDVTNITTLSGKKARAFFAAATTSLLRAENAAGVAHHVALSIVGIDRIDASYYGAKLEQERLVEAGTVPYTIARAAQFHEFPGQLLAGMKGPIAVLPTALIRPVAAREVAQRLVALAAAGPVGRAADFVGPRDERLADLGRKLVKYRGRRRAVWEIRVPGVYGAGLASGALRGLPGSEQGTLTFDEWLQTEPAR